MSCHNQSSTLDEFFARSRHFYSKHCRPIAASTTLEHLLTTGRVSRSEAKKYIETNRVLVHTTRSIIQAFLSDKRVKGTEIEKEVYSRLDWSVERFITRLIRKRPLCFFGVQDTTLLRDARSIHEGDHLWDLVGTKGERWILMKDYLTYDEMFVSSLLAISGYTAFLNNGNRDNQGIVDFARAQKEGVIVGLVGARFEREGLMDTIYKPNVSSMRTSPSLLQSLFPGETFEMRYKARMRIPIDILLIEAEQRGSDVMRKTWVHVVGLGLGVWLDWDYGESQRKWYIEEFARALDALKIHWIHTLEFSHINVDSQTVQLIKAACSRSKTDVVFQKRPPSARLSNEELLLVTSYAWDGNSYPGNEFYMGPSMLNASGDPAAAASSLISETQNPEINEAMWKSIVYLP